MIIVKHYNDEAYVNILGHESERGRGREVSLVRILKGKSGNEIKPKSSTYYTQVEVSCAEHKKHRANLIPSENWRVLINVVLMRNILINIAATGRICRESSGINPDIQWKRATSTVSDIKRLHEACHDDLPNRSTSRPGRLHLFIRFSHLT